MTNLIETACQRAPRNLNWIEWRSFMGDLPYRQTCQNRPVPPGVIEEITHEVSWLAQAGDDEAAGAKIETALALAKLPLIASAGEWRQLCRWGSLFGYAPQVVNDACEQAVALAALDRLAGIRDSRGLARALSGDVAGAIADFTFYVEAGTGSPSHINRREGWIKGLTAGEDPAQIFDAETLEVLKNE